ncbi:MAG: 2-hydroxyacid dehydrogenase [Alphaproteobacteria bacterium]
MADALLFKSTYDDSSHWGRVLGTHVPGLEVRVWPEVGRVEDIAYALVWKPEHGDLKRYPNLKVILSLGAGVDHVFEDPELPRGVPVARIVDLDLAAQLSEYVLYGVLHFHRKMPAYLENQRRREWGKPGRAVARQCRVGVMGLGVIGGDAARKLAALDFDVRGWSRTEKRIEGIKCFHGSDQLAPFLRETDILVCVLPLTRATNGIINAKTLALLPRGAHLINIARGAHIVDDDLLAALDSGQIAGALLDVFRAEPVPREHRFWTHPKVIITPHIAGDPNPDTAAEQVADNILRARAGRPLANVVNAAAEY